MEIYYRIKDENGNELTVGLGQRLFVTEIKEYQVGELDVTNAVGNVVSERELGPSTIYAYEHNDEKYKFVLGFCYGDFMKVDMEDKMMAERMRHNVINYLSAKYGFEDYLEIGLNDPRDNFNKVICERKRSVDPYFPDSKDSVVVPPSELTYHMTSDEMFAQMKDSVKFDIVFIDGLHEGFQVYKDFINSYNHLRVGGVIIMHDCKPTSEDLAHFPRGDKNEWYGTSWTSIPMLKEFNGIDVNVIDTNCGLGIYRKTKDDVLEITHLMEGVDPETKYDFNDYEKYVTVVPLEEVPKTY